MFNNIFGEKKTVLEPQTTQFRLLNTFENYFSPAPKNLYDDITFRTCVDFIAKQCAMFNVQHIIRNSTVEIQKDSLSKLLEFKPNEYMTTYDFLYKVISSLYVNNNAFIKIKTNVNGEIVGLYPLSYSSLELREYNNELYVKFYFNGVYETVPYVELIHLRRHFNTHDILGDSNNISDNIKILTCLKQALESAVKNSTKLKGIIKLSGILKTSDKEKLLDTFDNNLTSKTGSGHAILDNSAEYQELKNNQDTANNEQMEFIRDDVLSYLGLTNEMLQGKYTAEDYQAFAQAVLQPLMKQLSQEFTTKLFTLAERAIGHEIIFTQNNLQYISIDSKINLISKLQPAGCLTINEIRELFGFEKISDGDVIQVSLNNVKLTEQSNYQS